MSDLIHKAPSVGAVVKKILAINPDLSADQIIDFIRKSTVRQEQSEVPGEFAQAEIINEERALGLARESLRTPLTLVYKRV